MFDMLRVSKLLRNELTTFGLNPHQWQVTIKQNKEVHLFHKQDKNFRMKAHLKNDKAGQMIDRLRIVSL